MKLTALSVAFPFAPVRDDTAGGSEQALLMLDRALTKAGHRSIVVAREGSAPAGTLLKVPVAPGLIDDKKRKATYETYRKTIGYALRTWNIDIVHMHGVDFSSYSPPPETPTLVTLHLPPAWYDLRGFDRRLSRTYFNCVSRSQEASCPRITALLPFIENGVDTKAFEGVLPRGDYALLLGRICPEKGCHIALNAAKKADVPLLVAGEVFPYEEHVRYFENRVRPFMDGRTNRFLGQVGFQRKRRLLAEARCLLIPSLAPETSSLVAMEALASGTPVIAFPSGALAEIVEDGKTGFLVRDMEAMAAAIRNVDSIDSRCCRRSARERFSSKVAIGKYIKVYQQIMREYV